jgi:hypothetical protein
MSQLWSKQPASPSPNGDTASPTTPPLDAALDVVASPTTGGRQRNPGRRFAQIIKLKPECVDQYKECHAAVWPEVQRQIKACNIQDCECVLGVPVPPLPLEVLRYGYQMTNMDDVIST